MVSNSSIHTAALRAGPIKNRTEAAYWLTERDVGKSPQVVEPAGQQDGLIRVKLTWPTDGA